MSVDLMGAVDADVLMGVTASGFQGTTQRFVAAKVLLDSEWGTDSMVYMDDYPQLLRVAQLWERLTNTPQNATSLLGEWATLIRGACVEIGQMTKLSPALKAQFEGQLCASQTATPVERWRGRNAAVTTVE